MVRLDRIIGSGSAIGREPLSAVYRGHSRGGVPLPMARSGACHDGERAQRWVKRSAGWYETLAFRRTCLSVRLTPHASRLTPASGDLGPRRASFYALTDGLQSRAELFRQRAINLRVAIEAFAFFRRHDPF